MRSCFMDKEKAWILTFYPKKFQLQEVELLHSERRMCCCLAATGELQIYEVAAHGRQFGERKSGYWCENRIFATGAVVKTNKTILTITGWIELRI